MISNDIYFGRRCKTFLFAAIVLLGSPVLAQSATTLSVVIAGEPWKDPSTAAVGNELELSKPPTDGIWLGWSTTAAGAMGVTWQITKAGKPPVTVLTGKTTPPKAVLPGVQNWISVPASFLAANPPPQKTSYRIIVTPYDAKNKPLGPASAAVLVTQVAAGPTPPGPIFGRNAIFPTFELVSFLPQIGGSMQLRSAVGTLTLRAHNNGATATDPILLYANDRNGLMRQDSPVKVGAIPPHGSRDVPLLVNAVLPPAQSQMPDDQQYSQWTKSYAEKCGVAMQPVMNLDMSAPNAKDLMSTHGEGPVLYRGVGSSPSIAMTKPEVPYCDKARCVLISDVAKNISSQLDSKVVGYAYFLGGCFSTSGAAGKARLMRRFPADLTPVNFFTTTKMTVASVSKVITALAAIKVIAERQKSDPNLKAGLSSPIGPYLPPWNWGGADTVASITFRDLLSQSSGIRNHGNFDLDLSTLKKYFSKPVASSGPCVQDDKASDVDGADPASITTDKSYCYSNLNFAIFRILLPRIMGYGGDDEDSYAAQYVQIVQDRVFKPLGIMDADCKPNDDSYAFAYQMGGDVLGKDFGNRRRVCGGEGWYLSVEDLGLLLMSLNGADGRILAETQFHDMEMNAKHALGWDCPRDGACGFSYRWVEKNGELKSDGTRLTTSITIFGSTSEPAKNKSPLPPDPYMPGAVGVLFINSDVAGAPDMRADGVLQQAFDQAVKQAAAKGIKPKPSLLGDQR